eukprot:jgi/Tetstr1/439059/TSEL_027550.t1
MLAAGGVSTTAKPAILCFCIYPPYVYLDPAYDASMMDDLYRKDLDAEEFNRYFNGQDVELATALATSFLEPDRSTSNSTRTGDCDLGLSGFFYTSYRTKCDCALTDPLQPGDAADFANICCLDFSHPYDRDGFSFVTKMSARETDLLASIASNFNIATLTLICLLVLAIFVSGHIIWAVERGTNSGMFPRAYLDGVDDGLWWSVSTMTTVGYGDKAPITATGRCLGVAWMIVGLLIFGIFNAVFTSALTSAHVKYVILVPSYVSQYDGNLNTHDILPICTLGSYEKGILMGYGIDEADIRVDGIGTCYRLLNASTSPPSRPNHIGSVFYDRRFLLTDALPNVYAELYPGAGPPPLTTISPGVVVNSALQVRRLAAVLPKGSNLTHIINMGLDTLADGLTVYSNAAPEFENGWTLAECQDKYLGRSNNLYEPLHVEYPNIARKSTLTSWSGDISIITFTVAVTVLFLTVQIIGHWRTHFPVRKVLPGEEEMPPYVKGQSDIGGAGDNMAKMEYEMAEMRKTLQRVLQSQQHLDERLSTPGHIGHGKLKALTLLAPEEK